MAVTVYSPEIQLMQYVMDGIDLTAAAVQGVTIPPTAFSRNFTPIRADLTITARTGTLVAGPSLRAGNDGGHVNLFPLAALTTGVVGTVGNLALIPLATQIITLNLATPISVEVTIGATFAAGGTLVGRLVVLGYFDP